MEKEITWNQFWRTVKMLREIAGEKGQVRFLDGVFNFYGSELATLRLLKKYRECSNADQGYSKNLGTHYFSLEANGFYGDVDTSDGE